MAAASDFPALTSGVPTPERLTHCSGSPPLEDLGVDVAVTDDVAVGGLLARLRPEFRAQVHQQGPTRQTLITNTLGTVRLAQLGDKRATGIPEVDAVLERRKAANVVVA
jgi:hypothetical protein